MTPGTAVRHEEVGTTRDSVAFSVRLAITHALVRTRFFGGHPSYPLRLLGVTTGRVLDRSCARTDRGESSS